ncbi:MAG: PaaI family thioesterase [Pararhodobacter sp.]|nr:PaaI family thioesterase [Pararhodobacter sp.]
MTDPTAPHTPATSPDLSQNLPPHYPFQQLIGFRKLEMSTGHALFALDIGDDLTNAVGILHGGVHALLLDNALGASGCYAGPDVPPRRSVTLSLTVNFLAVPKGKVLLAEGRRVGGGRKIYFAEGMVRDDTGLDLARASGTFRYID